MANTRRSKRFTEILRKIPEDKRYIGEKLVEELSFMEETLEKLKAQIRKTGEVEHFEQGKQSFDRESPALKSYSTLVQRYSVIYRQLTDLIGKSQEVEKSNAVFDFIKEG